MTDTVHENRLRKNFVRARQKSGSAIAWQDACPTKPPVSGARAGAFTLTELLVVIAVLAILIALLMPCINSAIEQSKRVFCMSNMQQLQMAHTLYSAEHGGSLPGADTADRSVDWALYIDSTNYPDQFQSVTNGVLWPFIQNIEVYRCPSHPFREYLRHYSINNYLNARESSGLPIRKNVVQIPRPGLTISFIEEPDPRKGLMGSWMTAASRDSWIDPIGFWHREGAVFAFLDGHIEYWRWRDARTLLIRYSFFLTQARNEDLYRIKAHRNPGDPDSPFSDLESR